MSSFMTLTEAASELKISEDNLINLIRKEKISAYRIAGEEVRLKCADVDHLKRSFFINEQKANVVRRNLSDLITYNSLFVIVAIFCALLVFYIYRFLL